MDNLNNFTKLSTQLTSHRGSMTRNSIDVIVSSGLCTGCGACVGICPTKAIMNDNYNNVEPLLIEDLCNNCGLCYSICPGKGVEFVESNSITSNSTAIYHPEIGVIHSLRCGSATNADIKFNGASGGIATAIADYLLTNGRVNKAVIVREIKGQPFSVEAAFIDSTKESYRGQQSKYLMASFHNVVSELIHKDGNYLITGLPCQIASIRSLLNSKQKVKGKVILFIGLFCGYVLDDKSIDVLCGYCGVSKDDVNEFIGWRSFEYPGYFAFKTNIGLLHSIPLKDCYDLVIARTARFRCYLCPDGFARCSDISLGDMNSTTIGLRQNVIITHSNFGEEMIKEIECAGWIETKILDLNQESSRGTIGYMRQYKVKMTSSLIAELKKKGRSVPYYNIKDVNPEWRDKLAARSFWSLSHIIRRKTIDWILNRCLWLSLKVGREVYRYHSRKIWKILTFLKIIRI